MTTLHQNDPSNLSGLTEQKGIRTDFYNNTKLVRGNNSTGPTFHVESLSWGMYPFWAWLQYFLLKHMYFEWPFDLLNGLWIPYMSGKSTVMETFLHGRFPITEKIWHFIRDRVTNKIISINNLYILFISGLFSFPEYIIPLWTWAGLFPF